MEAICPVSFRLYGAPAHTKSGYSCIACLRLSRCYVHLLNEAGVKDFEKRFLEVVFHDKAGTHKNAELKSMQPTLGYAPNQRTPLQQAKQRTARL